MGTFQEVMFPKGPRQLVACCYAMEGAPAWEKSPAATLEAMMRDDYSETFRADGINFDGLTEIEKHGVCAMLLKRIESISTEVEVQVLIARFASIELPKTYEALRFIAGKAYQLICDGSRRIPRSRQYVADVVFIALRPNEDKTTVYAISKRHHLSHNTVDRDESRIRKWASTIEARALERIETHFADGEVLAVRA